MCRPLPTGDFRWLSRVEIDSLDLSAMTEDSDEGMFLEVDLEVPPHLHVMLSQFIFAPEHLRITKDMISPYTEECLRAAGQSVKSSDVKLTVHCGEHLRYKLHYLVLKFYVERLGLRVNKIHNALAFSQSTFVRPYIQELTALRAASRSQFKSRLYKLCSNSLFGKFGESVENRTKVYVCRSVARLEKYTRNQFFKSYKILSPNLVLVFMREAVVRLDKPLYVAASVLDLAKLDLMRAYFDSLLPLWPGAELLHTGT